MKGYLVVVPPFSGNVSLRAYLLLFPNKLASGYNFIPYIIPIKTEILYCCAKEQKQQKTHSFCLKDCKRAKFSNKLFCIPQGIVLTLFNSQIPGFTVMCFYAEVK